MQSELKACPFCGSAAEIYYPFHMVGNSRQSATYRGGVRCTKCWCQGDSTSPPNKAIAAWNTRAEGDATAALRELVRLSDILRGEYSKEAYLDVAKNWANAWDAARAALKTSTGEGN